MRIVSLLLITLILFPVISFADNSVTKLPEGTHFMVADFVEYNENEQLINAKGNIKIIFDDYFLTADRLFYDMKEDILWAEGNIKVTDKGNRVIIGETVILQDKLKTGIISDFILSFNDNTILASKLAEKVSESKIYLYKSSFTPCKIVCDNKPIWQISARNAEVDFDKNKIIYKHLFFEVYNIPIFYIPYFFHPTPTAEAETGLLVPEIRNKSLGIPLYFRAKPNLDFTFTPRIFLHYNIFELEARYKPSKNGYMVFEGNYGKVPYFIEQNGTKIKSTNVNAYYINTYGNFNQEHYRYGYKIESTSDKAYLKNYYENYSPYLASKLYFTNVKRYDYKSLEALHFQGLGINDRVATDPMIFPRLNSKKVIPLNDSESSYITLRDHTLIYKEQSGREFGRTAIGLSLTNNFLTSTGHLFELHARERGDIYFVSHTYPGNQKAGKVLTRHIPELQVIWRFPLTSKIKQNNSILIEPIVSGTTTRKFKYHDNKFKFIDPSRYEVSEYNIFNSNRYSGIDYYEFGNKLSYGLNSSLRANENYFSLFLGQARKSRAQMNYKYIYNIENVGKATYSFGDQVEFFYRFRKDQNFKPIRDEVGGDFSYNKLQLAVSFIQLTNLQKNYANKNIKLTNNNAKQAYSDLSYQFTENWVVSYDMRVNLYKKTQILSKSIKVTYTKDCVRIAAKISDNYMTDTSRGIRKTLRVPTISIGLKILNM